ncbi:MAG: enoyl-ACP reductase [Bdellovibrio sp. CG12_big_fil_rev_8_21_14_0_65_39_13]
MINFTDKTFLITGVANKKSVATHVAKSLKEQGAKLIFTVQHEEAYKQVEKMFPGDLIFFLEVENEQHYPQIAQKLSDMNIKLDGLLHSIAFANYSEGMKPFHETKWNDFQQASHISCFSLVELSKHLKPLMNKDASVVTISISNTKATNYGYMGPIKAMLDATICYLAKSFSTDTEIRFNAVGAGPLKTSASAGIPGYINNYLFAEQLTMRKRALATQEVANSVLFLLSPLSSGVNATTLLVDAGMSSNYFDEKVVEAFAQMN